MWPLVVGAATQAQAERVIDGNLLAPRRFFTPHPLATVAVFLLRWVRKSKIPMAQPPNSLEKKPLRSTVV